MGNFSNSLTVGPAPTLNNVIFRNNVTIANGGGMYNLNASSPILNNVVFENNRAVSGGGMFNHAAVTNPTLTKVAFRNNTATSGGGMYNQSASPTLNNVVISGNYSGRNGGGLYVNTSNAGGSNIDADPLFVDLVPATAGSPTTAGNYSLQGASSPAADAGSSAYASDYGTLDVSNNTRVQNGIVNMGAYEEFNVALPVSFGSISGKIADGQLVINWQTLTESNNDHFEIEASADGKNFTQIGILASQATNGNSSQPLNYEFSIEAAAASTLMGIGSLLLLAESLMAKRSNRKLIGFSVLCFMVFAAAFVSCNKKGDSLDASGNKTLYIRIAQVDKDGKKAYSEVVKVFNQK